MILEQAQEPLHSLRFVRSCSSALSPSLMERLEAAHDVPVVEAYGMTEASHQMTSNPLPPGTRVPGSVGVPTGAEVRIVDTQWREVAHGQPGEVAIRGPGVTSGYLNNPEANAESFSEGWFARRPWSYQWRVSAPTWQDQGNDHPGRREHLAPRSRGGLKVSPRRNRRGLFRHRRREVRTVSGRRGHLSAEVNPNELRDYCRASLAAFKVPEAVYVLEAIPRTATGKVQRRRIAAQLTDGSA